MARNFGNYGLGIDTQGGHEAATKKAEKAQAKAAKERCEKKKNPWFHNQGKYKTPGVGYVQIPRKKSSFDNVYRYMSFLYDLQQAFVNGGFVRKAESVDGVRNGVINYWMNPAQAIDCFVKNSAEWVPPTYNEYKVMWEYYYDLPTVVSRYYQGYTKPPTTVSVTAVPTSMDEPAQQEAETTSRRGYQYRRKMRQLQWQRRRLGPGTGTGTQGSSDVSAGPFSTGRDFMPGSGGASPGSPASPQEEVAISPDDVPDEGMGLGLKIAIGLGVLGIGAFVARRQGWI